MRSLLAITVSALALAGCVTENSYNGSNKPVVENKINNTGAARTRIALALQYLKTGNNSQAKYNLERAADFAPQLPEVHYSLAYYYQQVDENELADRAYQQALKLDPDDPNTLNNYGVFLCGIGEYDRAAEELLKAIAIPSYIRVAESYENLALCAVEFNDFENAEKYFKSALSHSSQRPSSLINLAGLYYAKSDLHKAQEVVEQFESTGRVTPRALMLSYLIQQRMGHIEKAETTAAIILQTYPGSSEAKAISSQQLKSTEFEILREKYRLSQLEELLISSDYSSVSKDQPKIRIVKKKAPPKPQQASSASTTVAANTTIEPVATIKPVATEESAAVSVAAEPTDTQPVATMPTPADSLPEVKSVEVAQADIEHVAAVEEKAAVEEEAAVTAPKQQPVATVQKTQPKIGGFTTVSSRPIVKTAVANDTSAVVNALGSSQTTTPAVEPTQTNSDDVKIVSFGAPQTPEIKQQIEPSTNAVKKDTGTVVFYEAEKDADVFNTRSSRSAQTSNTRYSVSTEQLQLPMLNPSVAALNIPYHVIQNGENLFSISVRYNVKLQKILQWNGLKESDRVQNGTKIYLNDPHIYHDINAGDTLYGIATQHSVLIDQLMRWNKLSPDVALKPGHRLLLVDPDSYAL